MNQNRRIGYFSRGRDRVLDLCREAHANGYTYAEIADELNGQGFPRLSGVQRPWTADAVQALCKREHVTRKFRLCVHCKTRGTSSAASKYCATCKDEVAGEQRRAAQRKNYAKKQGLPPA